MADPIIPTANSLVGPAIDAIVALRPGSLVDFNTGGRWCDLPAMWRAQALLNLGRLADEAQSARLRFATGDRLRTLCASEFNTTLVAAPQAAFSEVTLARPAPVSGAAPAGIIKAGTLFVKAAAPTAVPLPIATSSYTTTRPVYVPAGALTVVVPLRAQQAGPNGNIPSFTDYPASQAIVPGAPLFDPTFTSVACSAGGGSSGITDSILVAAAKAYAVGQFGPTDGAIVAGILRQQSVRHYAAFRANSALAYAQVYVTDESWGSSAEWLSMVAQSFATDWLGFGCRARFGSVVNTQIAIAPTIVLRSTDDLNNTDAIDVSVRAAARAYFDHRPDWYLWRTTSLRAVLSKADRRILHCPALTVTDAATGATLTDPTNSFAEAWSPSLTHYYLTDNNCTSQYQPPS